MKVVSFILVSAFLLVMMVGCSKRLVYEGPTPTKEIRIVKEKSCN